jgi:tRNA (guanine-N7-)-methyltransferase
MPRQQLNRFRVRKPSPAQLEKYYTNYPDEMLIHSRIPEITSLSLFEDTQPFVADFGCGRGRFTVGQAAQHSGTNYVGVDVSSKSLWDAIHQATKLKLDNIRFIRADLRWVMDYVAAASIAEAYIMFPKPHKPKTKKKDFFTDRFIQHLHRCLIPDSRVHFVTDHEGLFKEKDSLFEKSGLFKVQDESQGMEGGVTRYQQLWEEYGVTSKRAVYRRLERPIQPPLRPAG